jgi:hypothetical protein
MIVQLKPTIAEHSFFETIHQLVRMYNTISVSVDAKLASACFTEI